MLRDIDPVAATPFSVPAPGRGPLRCWRWSERRKACHTLLLVHGLGDHGRALPYARLAAAAAAAGHRVVSFDQQGHGDVPQREKGRTRFAALVADLLTLARWLAHHGEGGGAAGAGPVIIGLSMGALVALRAAQIEPALVRGVVAAAAPLGAVSASAFTVAAARLLGALWPTLTLASGVDPSRVTGDAEALAAYTADPLFHDRVSAGLGSELLGAPARIRADAQRLTMPLLMQHGRADLIAPWDERLAASLPRSRCTVRLYDGARHNLFIDPDPARVFGDLLDWLSAVPA